MNPTTDSQALLTKTFLNFTLFFSLSLVCCPTATPLFPIPYYYVQLPVNKGKNHLTITTISTLSIYLIYLYNARVTNTESQSQKAKKEKKKKKHKQFSSVQPQHKHQITKWSKSVQFINKNTNKKHHKHSFFDSQNLRSQGFEI